MPESTPTASPCIRVCSVNPKTGWCEGCYRTLKEIASWGRLSEEEREAVTTDLPRRRDAVLAGAVPTPAR